MPAPRRRLPRAATAVALSLVLTAPLVWGQAAATAPYADAQRLIGTGELPAARQRLEQWLQTSPADPQAQLLLGVVLSRQGDTDGARRLYESLTQTYPELPEPYNNLAVLHAAAGRIPEARAALESAIRFNPDYGTAHRNLGDVYLQLALGHWQRALALEPDTPGLGSRAQVLRNLLSEPRR